MHSGTWYSSRLVRSAGKIVKGSTTSTACRRDIAVIVAGGTWEHRILAMSHGVCLRRKKARGH
jgi:hypothetical protein